jgi:hypothetical protein
MKAIAARSIATPSWVSSQGEVVAVEGRLGELRIEVCELGGERRIEVLFSLVEAFRVMDERDLNEFWPACSSQNGWIFKIAQGGWLTQESERAGSILARADPDLREFLITGVDDCVSVLSREDPSIRVVEPNE